MADQGTYTATALPIDGTTADAADVTTDLLGLINEFNKSIGTTKISNGAVTPALTSGFDKVRVTKTAPQSVTASTLTALTWDTEDFDTNSLHNTSSNTSRLTAVSTGYYHIYADVHCSTGNTSGVTEFGIRKNAGGTAADFPGFTSQSNANSAPNGVLSTLYYLTAGDYLEVTIFHTASTLSVLNDYSHFGMTFIPQ